MIVKMKKVTMLCLAQHREDALRDLRRLGVLHLVPVNPPTGEAVDRTKAQLASAEAARNALRPFAKGAARAAESAGRLARSLSAGEGMVGEVHELLSRRKAGEDARERLRAEKSLVEPFGNFEPNDARELGRRGIRVRLFHVTARDLPPSPANATLTIVRQDSSGTYLALTGAEDFDYAGREIAMPARSLGDVVNDLSAADTELATVEQRMKTLAASLPSLDQHMASLDAGLRFISARDTMGAAGPVAWLQGFCPADTVAALESAAEKAGWGLSVEEPGSADRVPTLIRNPRWLRPIECLFKMIRILPGYHEADVSASFLLFLSLFFAMIVGDAGYGLVFLVLTGLMRRKMKEAPSGPFTLLTVFSLATIAWGVLSGAYFGIEPLPAPMAALQARIPATAWLADRTNIMTLCLLIGSVHLSVAHVWNAVRMINSLRAVAQLGWVSLVWTMYFTARNLMFTTPFPAWYVPIAIGGLASIVLFMTPPRKFKEEWINHAMLPLSLMSAFGDVLSYLRLYALGVAGFKVAAAFNLMAGSIGFDSVLSALGATLILLLSHALNIALAAMSVLVHGIRLNALEFSMHLGLEWSGVEYQPFAGAAKAEEKVKATGSAAA